MSLLSCAGLVSALILVSPEPADPMCSLEGSLMLEGPDGVDVVPAFAEVYVNTRVTGTDAPSRHQMAQRDQQFDPRVLVVQVGDTVDFRNEDVKPHEVHASRDVNLFNVKKENSKELTYSKLFLEAGISHIGCQIHSNMSAIVLTVPNASHVRVDAKGKWRISGLKRRPLEVVFWESGGRRTRKTLTPCVDGPVTVSLKGTAQRAFQGYGQQFQ